MAVVCNIYADSKTIFDTIRKNASSLGLEYETSENNDRVELRNKELPAPLVIRVSNGGIWANYKNEVKPTLRDKAQTFFRAIKITIHSHDVLKNPDKYTPLENHERTFGKYMERVLDGLKRGRLEPVLGGGD